MPSSTNRLQVHRTVQVTPSAQRLTSSLRDIGYDFVTALADLVDNSVTAGATRVDIRIEFLGADSRVMLIDNGQGMTANVVDEALRFGSRRTYGAKDLGKFGLGLKTASLSQCRRVSVLSRSAPERRRIETRVLDLDWIHEHDRWEVIAPHATEMDIDYLEPLASGPGTVVVWEQLDRVLTYADQHSHWARKKMESLAIESIEYLGMVFHRFLAGEIADRETLKITVNGEVVQAWDPFGKQERHHVALPPSTFTVESGALVGKVRIQPFILPPREKFSSQRAFEHLSGPLKWNRQQGLYIYRAGRLIQHGGWCGLRTLDEHTKLARAAIDFDPVLDDLFQVNVAKMRASLPGEVRQLVEKPVGELCLRANRIYREASAQAQRSDSPEDDDDAPAARSSASNIGFALQATAMEIGETEALERIMDVIRTRAPEIPASLGL